MPSYDGNYAGIQEAFLWEGRGLSPQFDEKLGKVEGQKKARSHSGQEGKKQPFPA